MSNSSPWVINSHSSFLIIGALQIFTQQGALVLNCGCNCLKNNLFPSPSLIQGILDTGGVLNTWANDSWFLCLPYKCLISLLTSKWPYPGLKFRFKTQKEKPSFLACFISRLPRFEIFLFPLQVKYSSSKNELA